MIITNANELASKIHDRMPVILEGEDYGAWLAGEQIPLVALTAERMSTRPAKPVGV